MSFEEIYHAQNPWWTGRSFESGVPRKSYLSRMKSLERRSQIKVVLGGRRTGKTTLLKQLIRSGLEEGVPPTSILYLQMDHPQLVGTPILDHLRGPGPHARGCWAVDLLLGKA